MRRSISQTPHLSLLDILRLPHADTWVRVASGPAGVSCRVEGVTLSNLPLLEGFWRSGANSTAILSCPIPAACVGTGNGTAGTASRRRLVARSLSNSAPWSDQYCALGSTGALCAVCLDGYRSSPRHALFQIPTAWTHMNTCTRDRRFFPLVAVPRPSASLSPAALVPSRDDPSQLTHDLPLSIRSQRRWLRGVR